MVASWPNMLTLYIATQNLPPDQWGQLSLTYPFMRVPCILSVGYKYDYHGHPQKGARGSTWVIYKYNIGEDFRPVLRHISETVYKTETQLTVLYKAK